MLIIFKIEKKVIITNEILFFICSTLEQIRKEIRSLSSSLSVLHAF
jgi:hypothetical protein